MYMGWLAIPNDDDTSLIWLEKSDFNKPHIIFNIFVVVSVNNIKSSAIFNKKKCFYKFSKIKTTCKNHYLTIFWRETTQRSRRWILLVFFSVSKVKASTVLILMILLHFYVHIGDCGYNTQFIYYLTSPFLEYLQYLKSLTILPFCLSNGLIPLIPQCSLGL